MVALLGTHLISELLMWGVYEGQRYYSFRRLCKGSFFFGCSRLLSTSLLLSLKAPVTLSHLGVWRLGKSHKVIVLPLRANCREQLRGVWDEDLEFQWEWIRRPINFISSLLLGEKINLLCCILLLFVLQSEKLCSPFKQAICCCR